MDNTQTITGIIFSYNRAMQLDALLRSFLKYCQDCTSINLTIIYKTEGDLHDSQYQRLAKSFEYHPFISFQKQLDFRSDIIKLLGTPKPGIIRSKLITPAVRASPFLYQAFRSTDIFEQNGFVLFLVDDALFIRDFNLLDIRQLLNTHLDTLGFSLRLGHNTTYCYTKDRSQSIPEFTPVYPRVMKYVWVTAEADFAYPLEISSSIYRIRDILPVLLKINFQNPNLLEGRMATRAKDFAMNLPSLLCYEQSVAYCNPANKVQSVYENRSSMNSEYSTDHLGQLFESGYRIDIRAYDGFVPRGAHQETELYFQQKS